MREDEKRLRSTIKSLIVTSLRLTMPPEEIADDIPLFREGLGLDSIDALELVMEIERVFGVAIDDEQLGHRVLRSVNTIAQFIIERQASNLSMRSSRTP
jgi:acyl carrier protein